MDETPRHLVSNSGQKERQGKKVKLESDSVPVTVHPKAEVESASDKAFLQSILGSESDSTTWYG